MSVLLFQEDFWHFKRIMVRVERRKGVLFSVILLGTAVSGYMYYYIRDHWNLEARVSSCRKLRLWNSDGAYILSGTLP